jgi:hypothetical protein
MRREVKLASCAKFLAIVTTAVVTLSLLPFGVASAQATARIALPLVGCETRGPDVAPPSPLPARRVVKVPTVFAPKLAVYTDGGLYLVAPLGWACSATVSQDGNEYLRVYPPGEIGLFQTSFPRAAQAITGDFLPACFYCYAKQACPFFPAAERAAIALYGKYDYWTCPKRPSAEEVAYLGATVVAFEDLPGVHGAGDPSGGELPANGVVTYHQPDADGVSYSSMETCTLPRTEHSLCTTVLDAFVVAWYEAIAQSPMS